MAELINKHADLRPSRMGDVRQRNLEVRGTSNLQGVTLTTVSGNSASFTSISASMASFATITASEGYISILTVDSLLVPATSTGSIPGLIMQVVETISSAVDTTTATMNLDDTPPLDSEGFAFLTAGIEPLSATDFLLIDFQGIISKNLGNVVLLALFSSTATTALCAGVQPNFAVNVPTEATLNHYMSAGTTATRTFTIRIGQDAAGTTTVNGSAGARIFGTTTKSRLRVVEMSPFV